MHPQPNAVPSAEVWPGYKRRNGRAKITNDAGFLPKRPPSLFAQARRRRDLVEAFVSALGGEFAMSPVILMHVRRAAELVTGAELLRAALLNGMPVDMNSLVRLEGHASRAVRVLGVKVESLTPPRALQRARARWNAQASRENKAAQAVRLGKPSAHKRERPPDDDEAKASD